MTATSDNLVRPCTQLARITRPRHTASRRGSAVTPAPDRSNVRHRRTTTAQGNPPTAQLDFSAAVLPRKT